MASPQALPLISGFISLSFIVFYVWRAKVSWRLKLATLVVALAPFNNPAFTILGLAPSDACGLILVLLLASSPFHLPIGRHLSSRHLPFLILLLSSAIGFFLSITLGYSILNREPNILQVFISSNLRLIVAVLTGSFLRAAVSQTISSLFMFRVISLSVFSILVSQLVGYLVIALFGVFPFGTFETAGFAPVPSFGAVSIERGHLGRLISFFPPLLLIIKKSIPPSSLKEYRGLPFKLVLSASMLSLLLTFSGSSYGLILVFIASSAVTWLFISFSTLRVSRHIVYALLSSSLFISAAIYVFPVAQEAILSIANKIISNVFYADAGDARSLFSALDTRSVNLFGVGLLGSQGREFVAVSASDLGIGVGPAFFGVFYFFFLAALASFAFRHLCRTPASLLPIKVGAFAQIFLFYIFETSFGQYTAVSTWFLF